MTESCSVDNVSEEEEEEESEFELESDSTEDSDYDVTMSEHTLNSEDSPNEGDTRKPAARKNKR